jgi:RNA polymerase sigma-70 factor (ECF subfamily)
MIITSFDEFFIRYERRVYRFLMSKTSDSQLAEEVANDVMRYAYDKWDDLMFMKRPDRWLFKAATRRLGRLETRHRRADFLREDPDSFANDLRLVAPQDAWIEERIDLIIALRSLRPRQRDVVALFYFGDQSVQDIAAIMNVTVGCVKQHLHRGLAHLREDPDVQSLWVAVKKKGKVSA